MIYRTLLSILFLAFSFICSSNALANKGDVLYMNRPATNWYEAFPLGNGRIGAMVYGGIFNERIQTNEDTFWAGGPRTLQKKKDGRISSR